MSKVPDSVTDPERRLYLAMLAALDHSMAQVLDTLRQTGQYDNTLIGSLNYTNVSLMLRSVAKILLKSQRRNRREYFSIVETLLSVHHG